MSRKKIQAFDIFNIGFMILLAIVMIYPFINIIAISFSSNDYIMKGAVNIIPRGFNWNAYTVVLKDPLVWGAYLNTILYAAGSVFFTMGLTTLMAYPLSIKEFKGKKIVTILLTISMFFSGGLIPTYLWITALKLTGTYWVMVIPGAVSAYNVFMFRTFFSAISPEVRESAYMDGANDLVVLFRIILPMSKALLATFTLFTVVGTWNSWFSALIYLKDERTYPLQLVLRRYLFNPTDGIGGVTPEQVKELMKSLQINPKSVQMAIIVITMLPITLIYPFVQKHFVKGVALGAVKG